MKRVYLLFSLLIAVSGLAMYNQATAGSMSGVIPHRHTANYNGGKLEFTNISGFINPSKISPQGSGSGLNADMVDGKNTGTTMGTIAWIQGDNALYAPSFFAGNMYIGNGAISNGNNPINFNYANSGEITFFVGSSWPIKFQSIGATLSATNTRALFNNISTTQPSKITLATSRQGAGSGLDADKLDGYDSTAFHPNTRFQFSAAIAGGSDVSIPALSYVPFFSAKVLIPAYKKLYMKKARYCLSGINSNIWRVLSSTTAWTAGSMCSGEEAPNTVLYDNSASAADATTTIGIYVYNTNSISAANAYAGSGFWGDFAIE